MGINLENRIEKLEQQSGINRLSGEACGCVVEHYDVRVILPSADGSPPRSMNEAAVICATCGKPQDISRVVVLPDGTTYRTQGSEATL